MIAAIDSLPLTDSIFNCNDYSGTQVHSLTNCPLANFLPESYDGTTLRMNVPETLMWSSGARVTAADYRAGILKASQNPFVKTFLLNCVHSLTADGQTLEFRLHRHNTRLLEVLASSRFSPWRDATLSSGLWVRCEEGRYLPHPYNNSSPSAETGELRLQLVKSPTENIALFAEGKIDVTADTAFPYEYRDNSAALIEQSVGLFATLAFSGKCSHTSALGLRHAIADICSNLSFDSITHGFCPRAKPFLYVGSDRGAERTSLTLAYDDFYPNREICEAIAEKLRSSGFTVNLVVDDYYNPQAQFDLKLSIVRGLGPSDYLLYAGLLFSQVLVQDRVNQMKFARLLRDLESLPQSNMSEVKQFIADYALLVPLFEIKSLYLSRSGGNPLTEGLLCS